MCSKPWRSRSAQCAPRLTPYDFGAVLARELMDKITILRIKAGRMREAEKLDNVRRELDLLVRLADGAGPSGPSIDLLSNKLAAVNARLWNIEDEIRTRERDGDFGPRFVALGRSVQAENHVRRDQTADQHARQFGARRREELCLMRLSSE
jgi:hypothetical protein